MDVARAPRSKQTRVVAASVPASRTVVRQAQITENQQPQPPAQNDTSKSMPIEAVKNGPPYGVIVATLLVMMMLSSLAVIVYITA